MPAGSAPQARQRWDQACSTADAALRTARDRAKEAGVDWLVRWFTLTIGQLASLQAAVDGKRRIPGQGASGLLHDVPVDLQDAAYRSVMTALEEVERLDDHGLDLQGWDWSRGFPPDWPVSVKDRLKAVVPWHDS